jgi:stage II sporulation protein D
VRVKRAAIALLLAAAACRPGEPTPPEPSPRPPGGREPLVRVGIVVDEAEARVGAPGTFELHIAGASLLARGNPGEQWTVTAREGALEARAPDGRTVGPVTGLLRISAPDGMVTIGDGAYRGDVLVMARAGDRVTAINAVDMETYLLGVVTREIGRRPETEIEAVKAQAVAARTYAIGHMGVRSSFGFDFFATVQDQVYGGVSDEDPVATRAVQETRGEIATWQGRPILAYYSSTCGGRTASIEEAWPWRQPLAYLRSVSDLTPDGERAYCDTSNRFRWRADWTRGQLLEVLGQTLATYKGRPAGPVRRVERIGIVSSSPGEGTVSVDLRADGTDYHLRADSLRWVLRPQPGPAILNSARLARLETVTRDGEVTALQIDGIGWGHAVGMCQVGAIGRARAGQSYRRILTAYYTGIELTTLY